MYYKRTTFIPSKRFLSRNEVKVFAACRDNSTLEDLINKTKLREIQVLEVINTFIAEGLMTKVAS